ncbi:histidinol dehydrogenase [Flexibacter flexilis DSM 6793]|uniref:Histidinol dehydrogenase n=1 Tax=Flexibacter flexilis DSM 6793 TaxID=927664 RepID=A0A1I1DUD0_9BACT|nr:histidinol dehydrogenase [Flexibacter flexilis]SFB76143.1 histidinol dehydrogenase [Flexibacter flexilis DSM 6793]
MELITNPQPLQWPTLLKRPIFDNAEIQQRVMPILQEVAKRGDEAIRHYTQLFDKVTLNAFQVSEEEMAEAQRLVPETLQQAIAQAKRNIELFHTAQYDAEKQIETMPDVICWRKSVGIEKVGLYIPGGTAPLFSTVLMLGVPAQIAGCQEIILCTPADQYGKVNPAILFTAHLVGIQKIYKIGGAQAIAAMAYGTATIPKVHKIFGPGNQYVTAAKQLVSQTGTAIDMPAGPSEVLIIADHTANAKFVAADLLSQAEHGTDSQVILLTTHAPLANAVNAEIARQLETLPRKSIAEKALENSKIIVLPDTETAMAMSNVYAPEHLILAVEDPDALGEKVINAGSVFLGHYTPESAGDYASGTNHTLPTNGYAKAYSGVSLDSFVRKITFQHISKQGLKNIGLTISTMAEAEQLRAHAAAVYVRLEE